MSDLPPNGEPHDIGSYPVEQALPAPDPLWNPEGEWAIVEIFGHRRIAGRVSEEERFGAKMLRIDIPTLAWPEPAAEGATAGETGDGQPVVTDWTTQWYGGGSIFSCTPTDEATVMSLNRPYRPARPWKGQALPSPSYDDHLDDGDFG